MIRQRDWQAAGVSTSPTAAQRQHLRPLVIISHHGVPEFGAAKIPATPEAIIVAMLDNLDAKATMSLAATRPDQAAAYDLNGNFTEKVWALDTKLYRPNPLA